VHHILRFLRWSGRVALVLYFVIGVTWLGLRYLVFPQADQWRGSIAQQLSQVLGAHISLGPIRAEWLGLHPRLMLRDVVIVDSQHGERLELPYLHATIAWRSLIAWRLQFARLEVAGLDLTVRRDAAGRIRILDQSLGQAETTVTATETVVTHAVPAAAVTDTVLTNTAVANIGNMAGATLPASLAWLLAQPHIDMRDVTLRWIDVQRQAPPLILHRVHLDLRNHGDTHQVALALSPSTALAGAVEVRAEFQMAATMDLSKLDGRVYARVDALRPAAWRPWQDVPAAWQDGQVWAQASAVLHAGTVDEVALDLRMQRGRWQWAKTDVLTLDAARLHVEGAWSALAQFIARPDGIRAPVGEALRFRAQAAGLQGQFPTLFDEALQVDTFAFSGRVDTHEDGAPQLALDDVRVVNNDMEVSWQGDWHAAPGTEAGRVDWRGRFVRLQAPAIWRYLPKTVSADARAWMRVGLLGGQIQDADFILRGDLMQFPFGDAPEAGDFSLRGHLVDGVIDYAATAATGSQLRWPRLDAIQGQLDMRRVTLALQADQATMSPAPGLMPIRLSGISAHIPNIERNAQLTVRGQTQAPAQTYLGLMRHSPLGEWLDHVFAEAVGTGQWQVPLTLVVPLLHSLDLTVDGEVRFADGALQLMPEMPPFEGLNGKLAFTHARITAPDLVGRFLGDVVAIRGGIGQAQSGLQFAGHVTADALRDYVGVQGMQRLQGAAAYRASLARSASGGFELQVTSDLRGLALTLPAPLRKQADAPLALQAHWGDAAGPSNTRERQQALDVRLGEDLHLRLLRRPDDRSPAYFHAGALTIQQPMPRTLVPGLQIDVRTRNSDASAWNRVVDLFSRPLSTQHAVGRRLLPDLHKLRVRAEHIRLFGLNLQDAVVDAVRQDAVRWQIDIQSPQTEGTLLWRETSADAPGYVQARFDRLAIVGSVDTGNAFADEDVALQETLDIPTLELHVRQFTLYDHLLGELSLTGVKQTDAWALESLRIAGNGASVEGRGVWHLRGAQRGLNLDALATVSDMGAYLTQLGQGGVMRQGQGKIQSQFFWRDLPWSLDLANLQGTLNVSLDKGRFSRVDSRTARLLELLSMQSLQRLARLDWNLDALVREGFPFDALRGDISLQNGKLHTQDYRVIGPVGTIVIGGSVDLQAQRQALQAVVIPNLDMSGAALAAGLAINPVVGVGAFLTQWLLKRPMENAMALEYQVGGTWDAPEVEEVVRATPQAAEAVVTMP